MARPRSDNPYESEADLLADLKVVLRWGLASDAARRTRLLELGAVKARATSGSVIERQRALQGLLADVLASLSDAENQLGRSLFGLDGHATDGLGIRRKRAAGLLHVSVETIRRRREPELLKELARELFLAEEGAVPPVLDEQDGKALPEGLGEDIPFAHVRHIKRVAESLGAADLLRLRLRAELTGLIVGRPRSTGPTVFATLEDETGSIQIVAREDSLSGTSWQSAKRLRDRDRLKTRGIVGRTNRGILSVFADEFERLPPINFSDLTRVGEVSTIATQAVLAALRRRASDHFASEGFEEIEPTYITMARRSEVEPLLVAYPGYGGDAHLTPSPLPQLRAAILRSGHGRFFCIGRCFSGMLRDGYTSAESLILSAAQLDTTLLSMSRLAERAVKAIFHSQETRPESLREEWLANEWRMGDASMPTGFREALDDPEIQLFRLVGGEPVRCGISHDPHVFRVCWPPGAIVAEGHIEALEDDALQIGTVNVYLERMAVALEELPSLRLR